MIQRERLVNTIDKDKMKKRNGPVLYWMERDQRVQDNWAILYGLNQARKYKVPLIVAYTLVTKEKGVFDRQQQIMLRGLHEVEHQLYELKIPFVFRVGLPTAIIPQLVEETEASLLLIDFNPLKYRKQWNQDILEQISVPMIEVDTHNIIPSWIVSNKQEYAAYTIRPKIHRLLSLYLTDIPKVTANEFGERHSSRTVPTVSITNEAVLSIPAGISAANDQSRTFIAERLNDYLALRNDPTIDGQSNLSHFLHFGQLSAQRLAWDVFNSQARQDSKDAFLEELIVRKELSDNYCYYNSNYDNFAGFPDWAKKTLNEHRSDERDYVYSLKKFETGKTHDAIWNRAQQELVDKGTMHGYIRMYWAKKILEWTETPEKAQEYAIYLNDTYAIDGRDPNGYTGIAWSIGGLHDRAWKERRVFGKVRFMNESGCKRKFDVQQYIAMT